MNTLLFVIIVKTFCFASEQLIYYFCLWEKNTTNTNFMLSYGIKLGFCKFVYNVVMLYYVNIKGDEDRQEDAAGVDSKWLFHSKTGLIKEMLTMMELNIALPIIEVVFAPGWYIKLIKRHKLKKLLDKDMKKKKGKGKKSTKNSTGYTQH